MTKLIIFDKYITVIQDKVINLFRILKILNCDNNQKLYVFNGNSRVNIYNNTDLLEVREGKIEELLMYYR